MEPIAPVCIMCNTDTDSPVMGREGDRTGRLCSDCAFWCDGNIISTPQPKSYEHTGFECGAL